MTEVFMLQKTKNTNSTRIFLKLKAPAGKDICFIFSNLIRMIEERVGPIIERGDILFNNLRDIQRRRMLRSTNSNTGSPTPIDLRGYEDILNMRQSPNEESKNGYSEL
jgi:hypothetical protein